MFNYIQKIKIKFYSVFFNYLVSPVMHAYYKIFYDYPFGYNEVVWVNIDDIKGWYIGDRYKDFYFDGQVLSGD